MIKLRSITNKIWAKINEKQFFLIISYGDQDYSEQFKTIIVVD